MKGLKGIFRISIFVIISLLSGLKGHAKTDLPPMKTLANGLEYAFIKKGNGPAVLKSHRLFISYSTRINKDTAIFDRNTEPFAFIVGESEGLSGWDQALLLMKVGDSAVFRIPPALAFGNKKVGRIPANSYLIFAVKVLRQEQAYFNIQSLKPIRLDSGLLKYAVNKHQTNPVRPFWVVEMNFTGYVKDENGNRRIFESSQTNSKKAVFQLGSGRMVKGLEKGVATMSVGEKATFEVAPYLGFGKEKNGLIPANSTLYYDIEVVRCYNPFFSYAKTDTIYGLDQLKILYKRKNSGPYLTEEQIAKLHYVSYYLNENGQRILITNTKDFGEPISMRPGARTQLSGFNKALSYLHSGDSVTLILPPAKELGESSPLRFKRLYFDVVILETLAFPFFKSEQDTVHAANGLKYLLVRSGEGSRLNDSCELTIAYTGYRIEKDGRKVIFDSSRESGQLLKVKLGRNQVLPGFEAGIKDMNPGEARTLIIPPHLAYGSKGLPAAEIPPNAMLVFDVELIQREKK